ncbi:hypothetical protein SNEBB_004536 [Seison nebaliae]|nr:hypothetical protein SNEBB_004536 [Seison nebaliae]
MEYSDNILPYNIHSNNYLLENEQNDFHPLTNPVKRHGHLRIAERSDDLDEPMDKFEEKVQKKIERLKSNLVLAKARKTMKPMQVITVKNSHETYLPIFLIFQIISFVMVFSFFFYIAVAYFKKKADQDVYSNYRNLKPSYRQGSLSPTGSMRTSFPSKRHKSRSSTTKRIENLLNEKLNEQSPSRNTGYGPLSSSKRNRRVSIANPASNKSHHSYFPNEATHNQVSSFKLSSRVNQPSTKPNMRPISEMPQQPSIRNTLLEDSGRRSGRHHTTSRRSHSRRRSSRGSHGRRRSSRGGHGRRRSSYGRRKSSRGSYGRRRSRRRSHSKRRNRRRSSRNSEGKNFGMTVKTVMYDRRSSQMGNIQTMNSQRTNGRRTSQIHPTNSISGRISQTIPMNVIMRPERRKPDVVFSPKIGHSASPSKRIIVSNYRNSGSYNPSSKRSRHNRHSSMSRSSSMGCSGTCDSRSSDITKINIIGHKTSSIRSSINGRFSPGGEGENDKSTTHFEKQLVPKFSSTFKKRSSTSLHKKRLSQYPTEYYQKSSKKERQRFSVIRPQSVFAEQSLRNIPSQDFSNVKSQVVPVNESNENFLQNLTNINSIHSIAPIKSSRRSSRMMKQPVQSEQLQVRSSINISPNIQKSRSRRQSTKFMDGVTPSEQFLPQTEYSVSNVNVGRPSIMDGGDSPSIQPSASKFQNFSFSRSPSINPAIMNNQLSIMKNEGNRSSFIGNEFNRSSSFVGHNPPAQKESFVKNETKINSRRNSSVFFNQANPSVNPLFFNESSGVNYGQSSTMPNRNPSDRSMNSPTNQSFVKPNSSVMTNRRNSSRFFGNSTNPSTNQLFMNNDSSTVNNDRMSFRQSNMTKPSMSGQQSFINQRPSSNMSRRSSSVFFLNQSNPSVNPVFMNNPSVANAAENLGSPVNNDPSNRSTIKSFVNSNQSFINNQPNSSVSVNPGNIPLNMLSDRSVRNNRSSMMTNQRNSSLRNSIRSSAVGQSTFASNVPSSNMINYERSSSFFGDQNNPLINPILLNNESVMTNDNQEERSNIDRQSQLNGSINYSKKNSVVQSNSVNNPTFLPNQNNPSINPLFMGDRSSTVNNGRISSTFPNINNPSGENFVNQSKPILDAQLSEQRFIGNKHPSISVQASKFSLLDGASINPAYDGSLQNGHRDSSTLNRNPLTSQNQFNPSQNEIVSNQSRYSNVNGRSFSMFNEPSVNPVMVASNMNQNSSNNQISSNRTNNYHARKKDSSNFSPIVKRPSVLSTISARPKRSLSKDVEKNGTNKKHNKKELSPFSRNRCNIASVPADNLHNEDYNFTKIFKSYGRSTSKHRPK